MYLSKVTLLPSTQSVMELTKLASNGVYASHQLLWRLFPEDNERSFIYREEQGACGRPEFFVLSQSSPQPVDTILKVQIKAFEPQLNKGDRLAFKLRVNPTVCITDKQGKSRRHDVLMHAKKRAKSEGETDNDNLKIIMEQAVLAWISDSKRLTQWGITLDCIPDIERYMQHNSKKRSGHQVRFSSVDFEGVLTVTDPVSFLQQCQRGFGRAKAMGCGLMMIRRV